MSKVGIYFKNGASVSRFSKSDYDKWDNHGRNICYDFFGQYKWHIENNDGKGTIVFNPCDTDLRVTSLEGRLFFIEAETKRSGFVPKYLTSGVHFTWRKVHGIFETRRRDPKNTVFITVNEDGDQLILVPGIYLHLAYKIWPEYSGFGETQGSKNFIKPEHDCYPLYKSTFRGKSPEHFINIAWDRVAYYQKKNNTWERVKKSDGKFL